MINLYGYQIEAVNWLKCQTKALLSLSMGLGKTCVTLTAIKELGTTSALVIVPAILRTNWKEETLKFINETAIIPKKPVDMDNTKINIVSYDFILNHHKSIPKEWEVIVCDEAHYLKNPKSKRTQTILGAKGLVHRAKRIYMLSGTIMPNHAGELWPILFTFGRTHLKYNEFVKTYLDSYENAWGAVIITGLKPMAHIAIKALLEPIMYKKTKEDVALELPEITYHTYKMDAAKITLSQVEIDKDLRAMFIGDKDPQEFLNTLNAEIDLLKSILNSNEDVDIIGLLNANAQGVSTIRRFMGIQKALEIIPLLQEELENKEYKKLLVFGVHTKVIEYLTKELMDYGALAIYGETSQENRDKAVKAFQDENSACRVLVCGIGAAGVGLNLTAGSEVVMLELAFTPAYNEQAIMRCHRIGQKNKVRVRFIQMRDSLDCRIMEILSRKSLENELIFN